MAYLVKYFTVKEKLLFSSFNALVSVLINCCNVWLWTRPFVCPPAFSCVGFVQMLRKAYRTLYLLTTLKKKVKFLVSFDTHNLSLPQRDPAALTASHSAQVPSAHQPWAYQESKPSQNKQDIWTQHLPWWQKLWWAKCWWSSWLLFSFTPSYSISHIGPIRLMRLALPPSLPAC